MKKLILSIFAAIVAFSASAAFTGTIFYEENFIEMALESDVPVDGWLTKGNGLEPKGEIPRHFFMNSSGKPLDYVLITAGTDTYAMANTQFDGGAPADQWLISPKIEVPYDEFSVSFLAVAYAGKGAMQTGNNTFDVYVSEGGTEKEDFVKIGSSAVKSDQSIEFVPKSCVFCASGYKGKEIRLAFVTTGSNVGFTGFTNISLAQYAVSIGNNLTSAFVKPDQDINIDYNFYVKTPKACNYLKATLELENGKTFEQRVRKNFYSASLTSAVAVTTRVTFNKVGTLQDGETLSYKLTLEPEFEGAIPVSYTGTVVCPTISYPNNVVVEEITATGCGYCPRGTAALHYYLDTYPGTETQGKAIAIAVHGYMNHEDPMNVGVEEYLQKLMAFSFAGGYPAAMFNRGAKQMDPSAKAEVESEMDKASYSYAKINKVNVPTLGIVNEWDIYGREMTVNYSVKNAYKTLNLPLNASVVLIENGVQGFNSNYAQTNYFYSDDAANIKSTYGEWLVPYIKPFLSGGELGQHEVPASKMVYEHVARLCYPTFYGVTFNEEWEEDQYKDFEMKFKIPENVNNIKNTELVLIITDAVSNRIVASDIMPFSQFAQVTEVNEVETENISISKSDNQINVVAENGTNVEVYSIDGVKLGNYTVVGGRVEIAPAAGAVIVKASNSKETKTAKLIF